MKIYQFADAVSALKKECEQAKSQRQWAIANGVDPVTVNRVLKGTQLPTKQIIDALGFEAKVILVKKQNKY